MTTPTVFADDDLRAYLAMCADAKVPQDALKRVMISESNWTTTAICMVDKAPFAAGPNQLVGTTLRGLGYLDGVVAFSKLPFQEQLKTIALFYKQPMIYGRIHNEVECYVANWLPAMLAHAGDPGHVYATRGTKLYTNNAGLDANHDGIIDNADLARRLDSANATARALDLEQRLAVLAANPPPSA